MAHWVTSPEAAKLLGFTTYRCVSRLAREGVIPSMWRVGGRGRGKLYDTEGFERKPTGHPKSLPGKPEPRPTLANSVRLNTGLKCPRCRAGAKFQRICDGRWVGNRSFACRKCRRDYQATTGTVLAFARYPESVVMAARLLEKTPDMPPKELASRTGRKLSWARVWRKKILPLLIVSDSLEPRRNPK